MITFVEEINRYNKLSEEALAAFLSIVKERMIKRHDYYIRQGDISRTTIFVRRGLMLYYNTTSNGDEVIKKFFYEKSFVTVPASFLTQTPSLFSIQAIEDVEVYEYDTKSYYRLMKEYPDIAFFHINYIEKNWIIAKEPLEISLKYRTAKLRYLDFLEEYKPILHRIKQHHVASFLGITPTQLSRIRKELRS